MSTPTEKKTLLELMEPTGDEDFIVLMVKLAFKHYQEKKISREDLLYIVKKCINARAMENGYVERFGLPFGNV